jgi:signal transduction histidine kinase
MPTTDRGVGISARARIVGWMLLLVGVALTVAVALTWTILVNRMDGRLADELQHEAAKFRQFAKHPVDPRTSERPADVAAFLTAYLSQNVPDDNETFFSIVDGKADRRSVDDPPARLDRDKALVSKLAAATEPMLGWADSSAGRVQYSVIPVSYANDPRPAALVAVEFRDGERRELYEATMTMALTSAVALGLAGLIGWLIAGRVLAPIRLLRLTAERITATDFTDRLEVSGKDDVAALARTFNRMLDRLQEEFARQRQFLDDAGHELRTPLTVVRGHLELMDPADTPSERAATIAMVTDELDRMNRIVNELLTLAKAKQPGFLEPGPVDMADLVVEVLAKTRPLGQRQWRAGSLAQVTIWADEQRLTQALIQLVANAVRHTREGDTIEIGSMLAGDRVQLWVSDSGPGVPPADRGRVFERFVRLGPSPGSGLGLAIVRGIAEAHGGAAYVTEARQGGACFVIELPLRQV